jgi:FkbM family methyltransferase
MSEYYNQDQLLEAVRHLDIVPKWLILGGPADGNEAQAAVKRWPGIKVVGFEPNPEAGAWQKEHGWPKDQPLLNFALSDRVGKVQIWMPEGHLRSASIDPVRYAGVPDKTMKEVQTTTLDRSDTLLGPFEECFLWLDIEGAELEALRGAERVLKESRACMISVELLPRREAENIRLKQLLWGFDYMPFRWWTEIDCLFVRRFK